MNEEDLAAIEFQYWRALLRGSTLSEQQVGELAELAKQLQQERDNWVETARLYAENVDYWRGCTEALQRAAMPVSAKTPELLRHLRATSDPLALELNNPLADLHAALEEVPPDA